MSLANFNTGNFNRSLHGSLRDRYGNVYHDLVSSTSRNLFQYTPIAPVKPYNPRQNNTDHADPQLVERRAFNIKNWFVPISEVPTKLPTLAGGADSNITYRLHSHVNNYKWPRYMPY